MMTIVAFAKRIGRSVAGAADRPRAATRSVSHE
jgi:hypothetical protein